jgi:outer membrane lipoprotein SlyB
MKRLMLVLIAGASVAGCATNDYGSNDIVNNDTLRGAAVGAAGGAAIGAVVPGISTAQGAAVGAAVGAVAGALDKDNGGRTTSGYRGSGWAELDDTVRSDYDLQTRVMARYDTNRDNELDRGEGQLAARDLRRMLDSNNDGNISREEYDRNRDYALRNI